MNAELSFCFMLENEALKDDCVAVIVEALIEANALRGLPLTIVISDSPSWIRYNATGDLVFLVAFSCREELPASVQVVHPRSLRSLADAVIRKVREIRRLAVAA